MALFTSDWTPINGDTFYRRYELYPMSWAECFWGESTLICVGVNGGPIMMCRDTANSSVPVIIYNGAGENIGLAKWNGELVGAGWSDQEEAVLVDSVGQVSIYDMFGTLDRTLNLGQEVKKHGVVDVQVFLSHKGTGVTVLCANNRFYIATSLQQQPVASKKLPDPFGGGDGPSCWTSVADRYKSIVLAARGLDLFSLEPDSKPQQMRLPALAPPSVSGAVVAQRIVQLTCDQAGGLLAVLTDSGHVVLTSVDLRHTHSVTDIHITQPPKQLQWCGSSAVVVCWETSLLLVTTAGESVTFPLDSPAHLCAEVDCLRLITPYSHEIVEQVCGESVSVFRIGSMDPSAVLLEAFREYEKESHKADEYLRMIRDKLPEAVTTCVEAASQQHDPTVQKLLLKAAQYGKCFVPELDSELFVSTCRYLRVLNSLHYHAHGMPVTYQQLRAASVPALLERLMRRRLHFLAVRVCRHLGVPRSAGETAVLQRWARHLVLTTTGDAAAAEIADKLGGGDSGVSFADVARTAIDVGKRPTAVKLLAMERQPRRTVPLLIELNMCDDALQRASDSQDPDLIYSALLQLRESRGRAESQMLIHNYPVIQSLYVKFLREGGHTEQLRDVLIQEDDFCAQARLKIREAYEEKRVDLQTSYLVAAQDLFKKGKHDFMAAQTDDQLRLVKYQTSLEDSCRQQFAGLSLHDTIKQLILIDKPKLAESLRNEYKVPDKRWWWIKVLAFSEAGRWIDLERFAKSKKSPIGYEPFVDACLENDNKVEARKYLARVSDDNRVKYLCKIGDLEDAARVAVERKDLVALSYVESQCSSSQHEVLQKISQLRLGFRS